MRADGELYFRLFYFDVCNVLKMYPLGEKVFGMKPYYGDITFGEGTLTLWDETGKKL